MRFRLAILSALAGLLLVAAPAPAKVRTYTMRSGPYTMGGFNTSFVKGQVRTPRVDGFVVGMHARLVDRRGRRVTIRDVMLHHVVFRRLWHRRTTHACTSRLGEAFYGTGEENESLRFPAGYGYRTRTRDRWRMNAMLMSHSTRTMDVYVQYRVRVVTGRRLTPVRAFWVRANGCGSAVSYAIHGGRGAGSTATKTFSWKVPFSGRIVAAGGHLHGGARDMWLSQPRCHGRRLLDTKPTYGMPGHIYYRARPVLHEPGPVDTRYFLSRTGIRIRKGERLRLTGAYENEHWHTGVMAIMHIYVAPDRRTPKRCGSLPADRRELRKALPVRRDPPWERIPLTGLDDHGHTFTVTRPPARALDRTTVTLRDGRFGPEHIRVPLGTRVRWRFQDRKRHNVRIANGPALVFTPTLGAGATRVSQFRLPGRYELFCTLHPVTMHEFVDVPAPGGG